MSITIDATIGGESSNSYVALADANTWFDSSLAKERWYTFANDERRKAALIEATRDIERQRLIGTPYDDDQALHFPRTTDLDDDGDLELPEGIIAATCHQALWRLEQDEYPDLLDHRALQANGVTQIAMDGISVSYNRITGSNPTSGFGVIAWDYLAPFINNVGRIPGRSG